MIENEVRQQEQNQQQEQKQNSSEQESKSGSESDSSEAANAEPGKDTQQNPLEKLLNINEADLPGDFAKTVAKQLEQASGGQGSSELNVAVESSKDIQPLSDSELNSVRKSSAALRLPFSRVGTPFSNPISTSVGLEGAFSGDTVH